MNKNLNSVHRVDHISTAHGVTGALAACKVDLPGWAKQNNVSSSLDFTQ